MKCKDIFMKYKIENDILYRFEYMIYEGRWVRSERELSWFSREEEIEIKILKPETPSRIKEMLQGFHDMGFKLFRFCWGDWYLFDDGTRSSKGGIMILKFGSRRW